MLATEEPGPEGSAMQPLIDSTDIQNDVARLRGRAAVDGYLLIRGLLPEDLPVLR